ncbi:PR domain zinc finger protein 10-like isoform X2 [Cloeon dipterum]|uniref:PR domain zinc finger protein 10-like isoform X2 n=1 Tax=Cloeon dipterum TaxID=197152 RepID=UPI00322091DD
MKDFDFRQAKIGQANEKMDGRPEAVKTRAELKEQFEEFELLKNITIRYNPAPSELKRYRESHLLKLKANCSTLLSELENYWGRTKSAMDLILCKRLEISQIEIDEKMIAVSNTINEGIKQLMEKIEPQSLYNSRSVDAHKQEVPSAGPSTPSSLSGVASILATGKAGTNDALMSPPKSQLLISGCTITTENTPDKNTSVEALSPTAARIEEIDLVSDSEDDVQNVPETQPQQLPNQQPQQQQQQQPLQPEQQQQQPPIKTKDEISSLKIEPEMKNYNLHNVAYFYDESKDGGRVECLVCSCSYLNFGAITKHYKSKHPNTEVLISRFSPAALEKALQEVDIATPMKGTFQCRLCPLRMQNLSMFMDHVSSHTGEFNYRCSECDYTFPEQRTLSYRSHWDKYHSQKKRIRSSTEFIERNAVPRPPVLNFIPGYVCSVCNWVQLKKKRVELHVKNAQHGTCEDIKMVNMVSCVSVSPCKKKKLSPTDVDDEFD